MRHDVTIHVLAVLQHTVALLVIGLLGIAAVAILLVIKKPWKKPTESSSSDTEKIKYV